MGLREKLQDLKRRLSDRKMYSIVIVIIGALAIWGISQYKHSASLRQQLDNQYNRAFFDMAGYVRNVDVLLVKALISSTPARTASNLQEAWRQANLAQTNLGQLPVSQQILAKTSKFLTQVGDLAYSLNNQNINGKPLNDKQYRTLEQLHGFAVTLGKNLDQLQGSITTGRMKWGELERKGSRLFSKTSTQLPAKQFEDVDKTFQNYPRLIYDGPFSDHLVTAEPRGLTGNEINIEQAKRKVADFFGSDKIKSITNTGKNNGGPIKTYGFQVSFKGAPDKQTASIDVSQKGGHIFWMIYNRPVSGKKINMDKARELGRKFLDSKGFANMKDTYYLLEDNTATINYAYQQDNVTVYPDLVKLKIALDNGEIIGIESKGYLSAHTARTIPTPKVTEQQARSMINSRLNITSFGLAIIPTEFKTEIFCYEFKGKLGNRDFLVYINAETGKEENILMIIDTPRGILTM